MQALGRRGLAFGVDAVLALMLTGIVLWPIWSVTDPDAWRVFNPVPLLWALCLVFLGIFARGATPGKRWTGLDVAGDGCLTCREVRRVMWAIIAGLAEVLRFTISADVYMFLMLLAAGVVLFSYGLPLVQRAQEFAHNTTTGFEVRRRR